MRPGERQPDAGAVTVSVAMTTYNHAPYIRQSVESVLAQEAPFAFELVVGDDCSTDGTRGVLAELQREHGEHRLRLVLPASNLGNGGKPLFARVLDGVRGRYVAALDGDDYWTDPTKLARQVAFLEAHPGCSMCFHDVLEVPEDGRPPHRINAVPPAPVTGLSEVLHSIYIASCAPMFRRDVVCPLPAWYHDVWFGDWPLYILAAERGGIGFIDAVMGVYRVHDKGMWNALDRIRKISAMLAFYQQLHATTRGRFRALARPAEAKWHYKLALEQSQAGQRLAALRSAWRALRLQPLGGEVDRVRLLQELVHPLYARIAGRTTRHA